MSILHHSPSSDVQRMPKIHSVRGKKFAASKTRIVYIATFFFAFVALYCTMRIYLQDNMMKHDFYSQNISEFVDLNCTNSL